MPQVEREAIAIQAANAGDGEVLAAIEHDPLKNIRPLVSESKFAEARELFLRKKFPAQFGRLETLRQAAGVYAANSAQARKLLGITKVVPPHFS